MKLRSKFLKEAVIITIAMFMFLSMVVVTAISVENDESRESLEFEEYIPIKNIVGTELSSQLFSRLHMMTCIPALGIYRIDNTLYTCVSVDGGFSWLMPHINNYIFTEGRLAPPEKPSISGPMSGDVGVSYSYSFQTIDPDGDDVKYFIDWDDDSTEWTSFYPSGVSASVSHTWSEAGTFCIRAKAEDSGGSESDWADPFCVTIIGGQENQPPFTPSKLSGLTSGEVGIEYRYTTSSNDPDNDMIQYGWDYTDTSDVDKWSSMYQSGAQCEIFIDFNDPGTYYIRAMAKDEHGAESDFSQSLTVDITEPEECVNYNGFKVCPIGEDTTITIEGNNLIASNLEDNDGFTTTIPTSNVFKCEIEDALDDSTLSSFNGEFTGSFDNSSFMVSMNIGTSDSFKLGKEVHPVDFNGSASGAPSVIAWVKDEDCEGNWEIAFRKVSDGKSSIDLGYIEFTSGKGVHPVDFNGSTSGAPSIIIFPGDECDDLLWTYGNEVKDLDINALMVTYVTTCETCDKEYPLLCTCEPPSYSGSVDEFTLTVNGQSEITVSDMWAKQNVIPSTGDINGPSSGKTGETYDFTISPRDSDNAFLICLWDTDQDDDALIEGVHPVDFNGSTSGAPSIIPWSSDEGGDFVIKVKVFDMEMGVSSLESHGIVIPKNKLVNINQFIKRFLENHPRMFPLLQMILGL